MAALARFCDRAAWPIIVTGVVLAAVSGFLAVTRLGFDTNRNNLIGEQAEYNKVYLAFRKDFPQDDDVVVVVVSPDPARNRAAVDRIGALLREQPAVFTDVLDRVSLDFVRERLLLYMPIDDLRALEKRLHDVTPFVERMLKDPGLVPLFGSIDDEIRGFINKEVERAMKGGGGASPPPSESDAPDIAGALPVLGRIVSQMGEAVEDDGFKYHSPWGQMLGGGAKSGDAPNIDEIPKEFYPGEFSDGKMYVVSLRGAHDAHGEALPAEDVLARLDEVLARVRTEMPGVDVGVTGEPSLEVDEMVSSERDSTHASLLSLVGVAVLFLFAFGTLVRPGFGITALLMAMAWTMGFAALAIGHLNVLTVTCMPMLVGLGIDFGIQVISRYDEERLAGREPLDALVETFGGTGMSIVTAGFTTSVSFLAARFTGFRGIGELGLLAAAGLMFSLLAMMTVLPAQLLLYDKWLLRRQGEGTLRRSPLEGLGAFEARLLGHPWVVLGLSALFTLACIHASVNLSPFRVKVPFVANLKMLQSVGTPSVEWEDRLFANAGISIIPALMRADTLEQARDLQKRLEKIATVRSVESIAPMFPTDQEEKLKLIPSIQRELGRLPTLREPLPSVDLAALRRHLGDLRGIFFLVFPEAQAAGQHEIAAQVRDFVFSADAFLQHSASNPAAIVTRRLDAYQTAFFHDMAEKLALIRGDGCPVRPLTFADVPVVLQHQLLGVDNKILLRIFPKEDIWDEGANQRFLKSLDDASLGQVATGTPRQMLESTRLLRQAYEVAGVYALVVIVVLVFLHFLSLSASLLALLPLVLGIVWGLGLMAMMGIPFNPANYMVLPLILGIGVANGIYVVRRFQEEGSADMFSVSTGRAILLSNLTAMIGFASLTIAKYQGIKSLGQVMTLGVGTCMLTSLFVLPVMLSLLYRRQAS